MDHASPSGGPGSGRARLPRGGRPRPDAATRSRRGMDVSHRNRFTRLASDRLMTTGTIWTGIASGTAGFLFYLVTVAVVLRLYRAISPALVALAAAFFAYAACVAATAVSSRNANFWTTSIIFWFPTLVFLM